MKTWLVSWPSFLGLAKHPGRVRSKAVLASRLIRASAPWPVGRAMPVMTLLIIIVLCIGCADISTNLYKDSPTYPPTDPSKVSIYHRQPQNVKFVEIGEITVSEVNSWQDAEKALKEGAARIGGDAVYIITQNTKSEGVIIPLYRRDGVSNWDTQLIVTGVVIKYKE